MLETAIMTVAGLAVLSAMQLRGDAFHNFLVSEAAQAFRQAGFEVTTECALRLRSGEKDYVDILARHTQKHLTVCCEVETSVRYTLVNAAKAEELGLPLVVVVPNHKLRYAVLRKLARRSGRSGRRGIQVLLLSGLRQRFTSCFPFFSAAKVHGKKKKRTGKKRAKPKNR